VRYYFADRLACPVCKASGDKLLVHPIEVVEEDPGVDPVRVKCRIFCHFKRRPADEISLETCRECSRRRIVTGVIVCLNCGRWYPIVEAIPSMLDDEYMDLKLYRLFARKYLDRIPQKIVALMKKPDPSSLLE